MPNRLADEKSPYLRQHADNPVDWMPWGEEALAKARAEQKPVFLSIGYSTCHWCHVMAHESFENESVAAQLNRDFVSIKVDREERPDLDRVYMTYVQQTTGHGGWPMSVWLTPEGNPFFGGTYFPPEDRGGRPGFATMLNAITRHWKEDREKLESGAVAAVQALQRYASEGPARETKPDEPVEAPLHEVAGAAFDKGFQYFHEAHDPVRGGFGHAPKFPRASTLNFLFRVAAIQGLQSEAGREAIKMATVTLQRMAGGGIHDPIAGGFHRYSVDASWHVPHFEKMLYDQAQIAFNYLEAQQATGGEVYGWVARGIFDYVQRDLTGPHGGFYSAEDADSLLAHGKPEHAEGAFYVWTKDEIDRALGAEAAFFCSHFGVKTGGNVEQDPQQEFTGKNVLLQQRPLAQTAATFKLEPGAAVGKLLACFETLRAVRSSRPRPHLDDKVITAWNGLMISALAKGHQVLEREVNQGKAGRPAPPQLGSQTNDGGPSRSAPPSGAGAPVAGVPYLDHAIRAAEFLRRELWDDASGTLYRTWREGRSNIPGFAEDYAYLIQGLLDLYEAGFEIRWLQWAERLQTKMDELFWDTERGAYFNSRADDPTVIVRLKEDYDGAEPAPNSVAALNLVRLDWMLGTAGAREKAIATIEALRRQWTGHPHALPQMLCALELALEAPRTVVVAGNPSSPEFRALLAVLHESLGPRRALLCADGGSGQEWLAQRRPYLRQLQPGGDAPAKAFVCEAYACRAPASTPRQLRLVLAGPAGTPDGQQSGALG